ncbi:helix-turn-helix domain-containing protein [Actinokineospora sp. NBRC 105648]|uniref:ArsR/SmtB family transcription factor n=1 Tax=Actinokineospora sp. NBRC 105648 TaxID=3032206 RepID=UPI0024A15FC8|nr:helix-turn-helix domain-containing protein [Actinokineospora sp. NBRC 105648]GLZ43223.1 transcriptional regulator [Actinokineospora sp. NBRC 105648]
MITIGLDAAALSRVRLAVSPALEALSWLRLAAAGGRHPIFGDPGPSARFALRDPEVRMVAAAVPAGLVGYLPDLLTPSPPVGPPERSWRQQLERIAATSAEETARQFARIEGLDPAVHAAVHSGTFARRAAGALSRFWTAAMADSWSGLRARLDTDLTERAQLMATRGIGALLSTVDPRVGWSGSAIDIAKPYEYPTSLNQLVLTPSALSWPLLLLQLSNPDDAVLHYPASGLGVAERADEDSVARLMGVTRALLLRDLDVPRTTTDLSKRNHLSPATVSYHLSVLHGSGLVAKTREKRSVLYWRTEQGETLR